MPQSTTDMLRTHPHPASPVDAAVLARAIDAAAECVTVCTSCADACLAEQEHLAHLVKCVRLNLDCADVCTATKAVLTRRTLSDEAVTRAQLQACIAACRACGDECEMHARDMNMAHCRVCADACRRCEAACKELLGAMKA